MLCSVCLCVVVVCLLVFVCVFFFKQKTAYEMRISDWSSDVCSSDLLIGDLPPAQRVPRAIGLAPQERILAAARRAVEEHRDQTRKMVEMEIGRASCRERVCQYV